MRSKTESKGGIEVDLGRYELRRHGHRVKLEKKPMDLLIFLLSRRDQLVSRKEIVAKLWRSDLFIDTEPNINNIIRKIRAALGDNPAKSRFLETVVGKGYRFVGPVRVIDARFPSSDLPHGAGTSVAPSQSGGWNERSSLAVLPLLLLGKPADDHGICLGFADVLITRLANLPATDVLPFPTVMSVPPGAPPSETASRLGVRFLLHGALQMSKGQWRLSLELLDTHTQRKLFSRKHDFDVSRISDLEDDICRQIALALNRPAIPLVAQRRPRLSRDPMAYAEFMRGYRLSSSGDPATLEEAAKHLSNAITRDPAFSLAHATLSLVSATRHFELDPASDWLERAEFHCRRALELEPELPEAHLASAFLLWGPSKNFQHLEAIAELKRALALQNNLPQAYNRLGTILAHIGLLDHAREMYERGRPFLPRKAVSHSIVQVYLWNGEFDLARDEIHSWRAENPGNKYPHFFAPQLAMMTGEWKEAKSLLEEALQSLPEEPLFASLLGVYYAVSGKADRALDYLTRACAIPKSFGHAHHSYYQFACILALLERRDAAFEWLQRSVSTGFACWPFFVRDPFLKNLRELPAFDLLISSLQAKYPDHLGLL